MPERKAICLICSRATSDKYCEYHRKSFDILVLGYESWKGALEEISWQNYLRKLLELRETGSSIRDLIENELHVH